MAAGRRACLKVAIALTKIRGVIKILVQAISTRAAPSELPLLFDNYGMKVSKNGGILIPLAAFMREQEKSERGWVFYF